MRLGLNYKYVLLKTMEHNESKECSQRHQIRQNCFEWNGICRFSKAFCLLISLAFLTLIANLSNISERLFFDILNSKQTIYPCVQHIGQLTCPLMSTPDFQRAVAVQKRGLVEVLLEDGQLDLNQMWMLIPQHFNKIWKDQLRKMEVIKLLADGDEYKYFISFLPNAAKYLPCTVITLGVGHTVDAERNLINLYPECRLIAADPSAEINANLTREIGGTFVHAAVGGKTATKQPVDVRREGRWLWFWKVPIIKRKYLTQIGIVEFLKEQVNAERHPVDLLMIDIEGAEFGIFEQLAFHYELFPTPICQINIEVHDPDTLFANYTHQQFFRSLDTLLRSGRFALMNTDMFTKQAPLHLFLRMFFVNIVEERCTRKFIC